MADALLGFVVEKSLSLIQNEFATFSGLKEKAEKLSNTLTLIKAVLEDAEERQVTDRALKVWLRQLKDAVHVLDDILEDCSSETHQHGGVFWSTFNPNNIMFRRKVGRRLNEIGERLDQIVKAKDDFGLREGVVRERPSEVPEWRETSSKLASPQVYGREEDKKKVVEFLLSPARSSDDFLSVYAIVGLGGLGKTTLAQMIFNDQRVSDHFSPRIWVCVSENFAKQRILCSIIECDTKAEWKVSNLDVTEQKVQELLQSKRYLLVLDDVWKKSQKMESGVTQEKWEELRSVLSCGSKGASILVSTRDMEVVEIMRPCQAHHLSGLSEDDCWSLFKQRAFRPDKEERAELVAIGKEIAKKCGGSPLAAKALGGLMRNRKEEKEWLEVKESELWTLPDENDILPALRLSYFHLTPTSKQCFAFCAIFPKDRDIMKQDLIHLWMANGFISSRKNLPVEEVGNMIWNELCQISFFQDVRISGMANVYFKMHDLVHDLAQSITEQECIYLEDWEDTDPAALQRNTHHICFRFGDERILNKKGWDKFESLRTLFQLYMNVRGISSWQLPTSLRVLRTRSFNLSLLGNLTHLRYLELSDLGIKAIPDSIYNLCKLEILKLTRLAKLHSLPKHLTRLQNLRHLVIEDCESLSHIFPYVNKLTHLRTLSVYFVETEAGHSLTELRDLDLGGKLCIKGLENGSSSEAREANLKDKKDLQSLILSWKYDDEPDSDSDDDEIDSDADDDETDSDETDSDADDDETDPDAAADETDPDSAADETNSDATDDETNQLLEALQPNQNLKRLAIREYEGSHWPSWMRNNLVLNKLVSLKLGHCCRISQFTSLGKLPSLEKLKIKRMKCVQYVDGDECYDVEEVRAFPSLESLKLKRLPKLERLLKVEKEDMFPRLSYVRLSECPKLRLPFLPRLNELVSLKLRNCGVYQQLPPLGKLPSLKTLEILFLWDLNYCVRYLDGDECYDGVEVRAFPSLESLTVLGLPNLEQLLKMETVGAFPCLSDLKVRYCPKLQLSFLPCVKDLGVWECNNVLLKSISCLSSLESLSLHKNEDSTSFPEGMMNNLTNLKTLKISKFGRLKELPCEIRKLNALERLQILCCSELESLPEEALEGLCSLRTLEIIWCRELRSLPDSVQHLTSLEALTIETCKKLESFTEQALEGLRSLRTLKIFGCGGLRSLPDAVQHLTSLEALSIRGCRKLECFPDQALEGLRSLRTLEISDCGGLRSLPDGVQHLTSLKSLSIRDCPALKKRCTEGTGEDWHKIKHIPIVHVQ